MQAPEEGHDCVRQPYSSHRHIVQRGADGDLGSDFPWTGYDYDTLSGDLNALLHHLDVRDVILVGHSAGAGEVVRYVSRFGADRVAGIALVSGTTPFPMKTADNPEGIDRAPVETDLAVRTADRAK